MKSTYCLAGLLLLVASTASPATAATFAVINTNDDGDGSLRWAMQQANAAPGPDRITFNIPGEGVHKIQPLTQLPDISTPIAIDARTQPGYFSAPTVAGKPLIELDGSLASPAPMPGLFVVGTSGASVRGLSIGAYQDGILVASASACTLAANHIGCDAAGTVVRPNGQGIVAEGVTGMLIGGPDARSRNVVSGNQLRGIAVNATSGLEICGNYVGTNASGTAALGNGDGIGVFYSPGAVIGGIGEGRRNLVSGNADKGIEVVHETAVPGQGIQILGNWVGTNVYGTGPLPNATNGIDVYARHASIGDPSAPNVVSGNGALGIAIADRFDLVWHNFVGTTFDGTRPLGNGIDGIYVVGSDIEVAHNVVGSNYGAGISLNLASGSGNIVRSNFIGTNASGARVLGNAEDGIRVHGPGNFIGGPTAGEGNVVAYNSVGILVRVESGNALRRNRVYGNAQLDIDLDADGITQNDATDSDEGANHLQNFPILSSVTYSGGQLVVAGSLQTVPNRSVVIDLFSSPACHASGNGGGETWLGSISGSSDPTGAMPFEFQQAEFQNVAGYTFTATATVLELDGQHSSTSEFSPCFVMSPTVAADPRKPAALATALGAPRPQPAHTDLVVPYTLARPSRVTVRVYDAAGRRVATLLRDSRDAGPHTVAWNTRGIAPGAYRVHLEAEATDGSGERYASSRSAVVVR
jgi:hypothetical protein